MARLTDAEWEADARTVCFHSVYEIRKTALDKLREDRRALIALIEAQNRLLERCRCLLRDEHPDMRGVRQGTLQFYKWQEDIGEWKTKVDQWLSDLSASGIGGE